MEFCFYVFILAALPGIWDLSSMAGIQPSPLQFSWIAFLYSHIHTTCKAGGFTSACKLETSVMQLKRCIWKPKVPFIPAQRTLSASFNQFLLILLLLSSYVLILSCGHKHPLVLNYAAIFTCFFNKFDMWKKRNDLLHLLISME